MLYNWTTGILMKQGTIKHGLSFPHRLSTIYLNTRTLSFISHLKMNHFNNIFKNNNNLRILCQFEKSTKRGHNPNTLQDIKNEFGGNVLSSLLLQQDIPEKCCYLIWNSKHKFHSILPSSDSLSVWGHSPVEFCKPPVKPWESIVLEKENNNFDITGYKQALKKSRKLIQFRQCNNTDPWHHR